MMHPRRVAGRLLRWSGAYWHVPNKLSRIEIIQSAIDTLRAKRYLEIGVSSGQCFSDMRVPEKIGVDPIPAADLVRSALARPGVSYFSKTSDEFFAQDAPRVLAGGADVVFIDGLHTDRQAYLDCVNALRYLAPGGVIFMHDNLPISAAEAVPADSYDEARRVNGPEWDGLWTGDGWKAIVRLRALHPELNACVLDCDHGVGVVWRSPARRVLALSSAEIDAMTYDDLVMDPRRLLGLEMPEAVTRILAECVAAQSLM